MKNSKLAQSDLLADEVDVDLDVFHAAVVDGVGSHVDGAHIVAVDNRRKRDRDVEFLEQLAQPAALDHNVGDCTVLCFGTGARHRRLALGGPRHQVVAEVDAEAGGGAARVWVAGPVSVGVGSELVDGTRA